MSSVCPLEIIHKLHQVYEENAKQPGESFWNYPVEIFSSIVESKNRLYFSPNPVY